MQRDYLLANNIELIHAARRSLADAVQAVEGRRPAASAASAEAAS